MRPSSPGGVQALPFVRSEAARRATDKDIIFTYRMYGDYGGGNSEFRVIPTDGRQHNENQARQATYYGYAGSISVVRRDCRLEVIEQQHLDHPR